MLKNRMRILFLILALVALSGVFPVVLAEDMSQYVTDVYVDSDGVVVTVYDVSSMPEGTILPNVAYDEDDGENADEEDEETPPVMGISPLKVSLVGDLDVSVNFLYGGEYYENILKFGQTLTVELYAKNTSTASKVISLYAATYDGNGQLTGIFPNYGTIANNNTYQAISVNVPLPATYTLGYKVKVFVWDNEILKPYIAPITLEGTANNDYYTSNINTTNFINYTNPINGRITASTDVDYIKFVPATTGDYIIQTTGTTNTAGTLYDSNKASIATNNNISSADTNFGRC